MLPRLVIFELEVLLLKRNGVVNLELTSVFENVWEIVLGEIRGKGERDIGEHEADVIGGGVREDGGESGERVYRASSVTRDRAIGEDQDRSNGVSVLLDLGGNFLPVVLVLLDVASLFEPRRIEDTNLEKRLYTFIAF